MTVYDYSAKTIRGEEISLSQYRGKVLLIVNTASACGFTPQYKGLQELYTKHREAGLEILGFPCNQFGGQEPGAEAEIAEFCEANFGVTFPLFAKVEVNGDDAHPLFKYLTKEAPGILGTKSIKWNFTKFLVDREGRVVDRYASTDSPEKLEKEISKVL